MYRTDLWLKFKKLNLDQMAIITTESGKGEVERKGVNHRLGPNGNYHNRIGEGGGREEGRELI